MKLPILAAMLLTAAAACGPRSGSFSRGSAPPAPSNHISDADFSRVPKAQLGAVDSTRLEVQQAKDAAMRADQKVAVAERKIDVAKTELSVRKAEVELAKSEMDLAKATGDRGRIDAATSEQQRADARVELETARADVIGRERDRLAAQAALAHKQVKVAEAKLELAKMDALKASGDASADRYHHENFDQALSSAQAEVRRAEEDLRDDSLLRQARVRLDQAKQAVDRLGGETRPVRGIDEPTD